MRRLSGEISLVVGGAAGQGIQTVEAMLVAVLKKEGYRVFACKEYMSRVRGGSNSTEIRIARHRPRAFVSKIDILLALDKDVIPHLVERISPHTIILGEKDKVSHPGTEVIDAPFTKFATEAGNPLFASTVAVGMVLGLLHAEMEPFLAFLEKQFGRKGEDIVKRNVEAAKKGYDFGSHVAFMEGLEVHLFKDGEVNDELLLDGTTALSLGAAAAGCDFVSSYPMSPGTGLLTYLAGESDRFNIVVDQAEDEIAAINMALGAWYAGARALVTTSGGGFALMCEGMSLSGMIETPVVVHIGMRPGPATGLPTRTEQADLNLALFAGHGEYPRAIYSPGTLAEAYETMQRAFATADTFQIPVVILSDQYFLDSVTTVPLGDLATLPVEKAVIETSLQYKRYAITDNGISPRGIPGYGNGLVGVDSDEHDEEAHITESAHVRVAMHEKRFRKYEALRKEAMLPTVLGDIKKAKHVIVTWGSNRGVLEEALDHVKREDVVGLHFAQAYPINPGTKKLFGRKKVCVMENNATGQFADLLERDLDIKVTERFLQYNGNPFSLEDVVRKISHL